MRCSECGRPARAWSAKMFKKNGNRKRSRRPHAIKDHDLCQRCHESLADKRKAIDMATTTRQRRESSATAQHPDTIPPLKIARLEAQNFMRLRAIEVQLDGKSVKFVGRNASGKSSCLLAILAALGKIAGREIPEPILRGEDKATVELDLSDAETGEIIFLVVSKWTENGRDITVRAPDGSRYNRPQELLDSFLDFACLRPCDWLSHRPQDQIDDVLRICDVPCPVADVQEITGERHEPKAGESAIQYLERLSADESGVYYVRRRDANRDWKLKVAALEEHRGKLAAVPALNGSDTDMATLTKRRAALEATRKESLALQANVNELANDRQAGANAIAAATRDKAAAETRANNLEVRIAALQQELAAECETIKAAVAKLERDAATLAEVDADMAKAREALAAAPDPSPQIAELDRQIDDHNRNAKARHARETLAELVETLSTESDELCKLHGEAEIKLTRIRALRRNLLNGVNLGVDGLQIGDGELLLKGVTFRQASQAQRLLTALTLMILRNPLARFTELDNSEQLDDESQVIAERFAREHDMQLIEAGVVSGTDLAFQIAADF